MKWPYVSGRRIMNCTSRLWLGKPKLPDSLYPRSAQLSIVPYHRVCQHQRCCTYVHNFTHALQHGARGR